MDSGKLIKSIGVGVSIFVMVLTLGILLMAIMSYTARDDTTATVGGITVLTNGSLTNLGASYPYVQGITDCVNLSDATDTLNAANYTVVEGNAAGNGGFILKDTGSEFVGEDVNCSVSYKKTTTATTSILALIVTIGAIGGLGVLFVLIMLLKPFFGMIKE